MHRIYFLIWAAVLLAGSTVESRFADRLRTYEYVNGTNGFRIVKSGDQTRLTLGYRLSAVSGDMNGDGYKDFLVQAENGLNSDTFNYHGTAFVIFGSADFPDTFDVNDLDGENGFFFSGSVHGDNVGYSSTFVDLNNDGFSDLVVGAVGWDADVDSGGSIFVIYGKSGAFPSNFDLGTLDGSTGFRIRGLQVGGWMGSSVSPAGDVNADGIQDLILGEDQEGSGPGRVFVIFGSASGFDAEFDLDTLNGSNGFRINGAIGNSRLGYSVSSAGDVNADGFGDVIFGVPSRPHSGNAYVLFGKSSGFQSSYSLSDLLDGISGFRITGTQDYDNLGATVALAGDVNGDGVDDIMISATGDDNTDQDSGSVYVIFGSADGFGGSVDVMALDGTDGFRVDGYGYPARYGSTLSTAGDLDGDGVDDIMCTSASENGFVVYGSTTGFEAVISASQLDGSIGFEFLSAFRATSVGDVNGDGRDDILVGYPRYSEGEYVGGAAFVIYGIGIPQGPQIYPCGNNVVEGTEECDDGNKVSGDGCDSFCADEDECTSGVHSCDANALCNNIIGSYDCTCGSAYMDVSSALDGSSCACAPGYGSNDGEECVICGPGADSPGANMEACTCVSGFYEDNGECVPAGATSDSFGIAVTSAMGTCPDSGNLPCWQINVGMTGTPPAAAKQVLYLHSAPVAFPCSFTTTKCDCLLALNTAYHATTLGDVEASFAVCDGSYNDTAFPAPLDLAQTGVSIQESDGDYTIFITEAALDSLTTLSPVDGGYKADLQVGFVELLPVGDMNYFDAVPHETTVTLEQTFFATYSSVSAQQATSLSFANARVHKVYDSDTIAPASDPQYYVAVSFVVEGGNVTGVEVPTTSIVVTAGGAPIDIACGVNSFTAEEETLFRQSCAPFSALPDDTMPPFCSGTLHVMGSSGLASLYIPLMAVVDDDSLMVEFVISTSGTDTPTFETVSVTINSLGDSGGFVEWCEAAVSDSVNFVTDSALDVDMYAGVVLPEEEGLSSLASLGSVASDTPVPAPRATVLDGVISVTVNHTSGYDIEVVKLAAVYVEGATPGTSVDTSYLTRIPTAEYDPATGEVSMGTDNLCVDDDICEVKVLEVESGSTPQCLQLKASPAITSQAAADWIKDVAGTRNPFVDQVGQHFFEQFADFKAAYWINPRKDTSAAAVAVGASIPSTTVAVFALLRVSASAGERRSSRYLLQAVGGGSDSLSSGVVRLEVSAASLAASVLGVSPEVVTTWSLQMSVSAQEACLPEEELIKSARVRLLAALADAASELVDVQVTSVTVDAAGVQCASQGRRLLSASASTMEVEALFIFADDGSKPFVDVAKLEAAPGIHSVAQSDSSSVETVAAAPPTEEQRTDPAALGGHSAPSSGNVLIIAASAAGVVAVVAVVVALWACRRTARSDQAVLVSAVAMHDSFRKGDKMEQVLGNITCTLEVDPGLDSASRSSSVRAVESQA